MEVCVGGAGMHALPPNLCMSSIRFCSPPRCISRTTLVAILKLIIVRVHFIPFFLSIRFNSSVECRGVQYVRPWGAAIDLDQDAFH